MKKGNSACFVVDGRCHDRLLHNTNELVVTMKDTLMIHKTCRFLSSTRSAALCSLQKQQHCGTFSKQSFSPADRKLVLYNTINPNDDYGGVILCKWKVVCFFDMYMFD